MSESYGVIVFEYEGDYFYHNLRAEIYDSFKEHMAESKMKFIRGRNNISEKDMRWVVREARWLALRLKDRFNDNINEELKDLRYLY